MRFRPLAALFTAALFLAVVPIAFGLASHAGWPHFYHVKANKRDRDRTMNGRRRSDKLLGGHGDDVVNGKGGDDVIWGDYKPANQTSRQQDHLNGDNDDDIIYASHGRNVITGGDGSDVIHAFYGRGSIDCGPGRDALYLPKRRGAYKISNCEYKRRKTGQSAPKWWLRTHKTGRRH